MLIETPGTWLEARAACQSAGGELADIANPLKEATVVEVMQQAGVMNAWLCNEVKGGVAPTWSNWGADVDLDQFGAGQSKYYVHHACSDTTTHDCDDRDEQCTDNLDDDHYVEFTFPLGGCCDSCPAGYKERYDIHHRYDIHNALYDGTWC